MRKEMQANEANNAYANPWNDPILKQMGGNCMMHKMQKKQQGGYWAEDGSDLPDIGDDEISEQLAYETQEGGYYDQW